MSLKVTWDLVNSVFFVFVVLGNRQGGLHYLEKAVRFFLKQYLKQIPLRELPTVPHYSGPNEVILIAVQVRLSKLHCGALYNVLVNVLFNHYISYTSQPLKYLIIQNTFSYACTLTDVNAYSTQIETCNWKRITCHCMLPSQCIREQCWICKSLRKDWVALYLDNTDWLMASQLQHNPRPWLFRAVWRNW